MYVVVVLDKFCWWCEYCGIGGWDLGKKWNKIDFRVWIAKNAYGTKITSRWCQTCWFPRATKCGSLCEIEEVPQNSTQLSKSAPAHNKLWSFWNKKKSSMKDQSHGFVHASLRDFVDNSVCKSKSDVNAISRDWNNRPRVGFNGKSMIWSVLSSNVFGLGGVNGCSKYHTHSKNE